MENKSYRSLKVFKALSNVIRYNIICLLFSREYEVSELNQILKKPASTVSRHLKILRDLDIVSYYTKESKVIYSLKNIELYKIIKATENLFYRK